jgi:hypothetical protein
MDIAWFRDLVICVWGLVATLLMIFIAILVFLLYRKVQVVIKSVEMTSSTISRITSTLEDDIISPIVKLVPLAQGIRLGADFISRLFKRNAGKEGGRHEQ